MVLEPDRAASHRAPRLLCRMTARCLLAVHAPPEKPMHVDWPDAVRIDNGLVGGGRLAWPEGADEDAPPQWLVFGAMIRTVSMLDGRRAAAAFGRTGGRGLRRSVLGSAGRDVCASPDGGHRWVGGARLRAVAKEYLSRLATETGVRRDIDDTGDLAVRRRQDRQRASQADPGALPRRRGSIPQRRAADVTEQYS